jgi:hypothetical protein
MRSGRDNPDRPDIRSTSSTISSTAFARASAIARNGADTEDIVFIDDLSEVLAINKTINEQSADSASMALAARYSTMLKAALHVLLQIRQLHSDVGAHRPERLTRRN